MNYTIQHKGCGTVACIGGWTALRAGMSRRAGDKFVKLADGGLRELFYPLVPGSNNKVDQNVTNEQAVRAIDNFVATGKPDWNSARGY